MLSDQLRTEIRRLMSIQMDLSRKIRELSWKPGSEEAMAQIRSERDEAGRKKYGKKALKPFRRPETGSERNDLWLKKRSDAWDVRNHLVLLGMVRGRGYKQLERTTHPLSAESLMATLMCFQTKPTVSLEEIDCWISGEVEFLKVPHEVVQRPQVVKPSFIRRTFGFFKEVLS